MSRAPGTKLGPYEILAPIGAGGMGEVFRARDRRLDREVAIKVLPAGAAEDEVARARLVREARLASKLNHPNICTIYEVGEADGQVFVAMELVVGETLADRLAARALSLGEVLQFGRQLADALAHAHEHGVIHRDFKSANVITTPEGRAKVLDFGLAKKLSLKEAEDATTLSRATLTEAGTIAGTPAYMAPEQLRGQPADARSDVWALGVVLYEMAAGKRPFQGSTGFELTSAILSQPPQPLPASLPGPLRGLIERCLAKEPSQRCQRGGEVKAALESLSSGRTPSPWPAVGRTIRRRPGVAFAAALLATIALLVALNVGGLKGRLFGGSSAPARALKLAVLPFANLSGSPEHEYLSEGLTQEMIARLGSLHPASLSVIARTSVMRYKATDKPADQIGRELGVDYLLEGSVRREGGRVRVSAELIKAQDQTQLWAETYDRDLAGILALQSDVAGKVAGSLALKLLPAEQARLANVRAVSPEAHDAYLKGLYHAYKLTRGDLESALKYFELALAKEPNYALAHAGVSLSWACLNQMGLTPSREAAPKALAAALKAVELDDSLAEAHRALAAAKTWDVWDLKGAGPEWERAVELNPNLPDTRAFYSHYLMHMRRPEEAMVQIRRALELDPFNPLFQGFYAGDLFYLRRYDDAIAQARSALRAQPGEPVSFGALYASYFCQGKFAELVKLDREQFAGDPELKAAYEQGLAESGYAAAMGRCARIFASRYGRPDGPLATTVAWDYVYAGDKDRALEWLEKAFEDRDPNLPYLGTPDWDALRPDPRFQSLLRRIGLPTD